VNLRRTLIALSLLVPLGLLAGQLDPRLRQLRQGWAGGGAAFSQKLAEDAARPRSLSMVRRTDDRYVVPTTISLVSTETLDRLRIPYTVVTPTVVTADVPLSALEALEQSMTIRQVQLAHLKRLHNDINAPKMKTSVPWGAGYTGTNVLVGVIDTGIDVNHPAFRAGGLVGGASRIKYLYSNGHGTHVAGSVAGYDAAYEARAGSAKGANILFVKTTFSSTDILNGLVWLNEQAKALGKPIVVNLSLGSESGPHDGTDPEAKAIDDLVAASNGSLIVVRSAGNNANDGHHGSATATVSGVSMPVTVPAYTVAASTYDTIVFDLYADAAAEVSIRITNPGGGSTGWIAPSASPVTGTLPDGTGYYLENHSAAETTNPAVKSMYLEIGEYANGDGKEVRPGTWTLEFRTASGTTRVDGWMWYQGGADQIDAVFATPDKDTTLGNEACGNNIIAVAAYVSRYSWQASNGSTYHYVGYTQDTIAPFSSVGPTRDGRQKPDVTAGGSNVLSARSAATSPSASQLPFTGSQTYAYMQGTSMSSPTLAGAVALLKEIHPAWTYADMLNYFRTNSQGTSAFTTFGTWNKNWGWGVVDLTSSLASPPTGPSITTHPASQAVNVGQTATFSVAATASAGTLSYQWKKNGSDVGANSSSYTTPAAVLGDNGAQFTVVVTDANGSTPSNAATLTVTAVTPVVVTVSPKPVTLLVGGSQIFTAAVTGTGNTAVTWSGTGAGFLSSLSANSTTFTASTAGSYVVTATSAADSSKSDSASVTVKTRDLNGDGSTDVLDLASFARAHGSTSASSNWNAACDLNGDGSVDDTDIALFLAGF